ncbi:MAG: hypothetical protein IKI03_07260 [Clostridia bacterium]|nr:hypothetical protein [Clostridia bacterium]
MDRIIRALNDRESGEINQIRKAVRCAGKLQNDDIYCFVNTENVYTYIPFILKEETVYSVLLSSCEEMKHVVTEGNFERIIDLADCLHNLPIYISENKSIIPKIFWKNEVAFYRKKWDEDFLVKEQKLCGS